MTSSDHDTSEDDRKADPVQDQILRELKKVNTCLDAVEDLVTKSFSSQGSSKHTETKLSSSSVCVKQCRKTKAKLLL